MKGFILASLFLLSHLETSAQTGLIKTIDLDKIKHVTLDRAGDIYVNTSSSLIKFDKDGKKLGELSNFQCTSFDTGNGVRLLAYNRKEQQYTILTPTLTTVKKTPIDNSIAITPWLVCSSGDYNILLLDVADWSIKKVDTRQGKVLNEFKIDSTLTESSQLISLCEYQNFIFLLDTQTGITIFNSLGLKVKTIEVKGVPAFHFLGQELYYYRDGRVHFFDLFTTETRFEDIPGSFDSVLLTDERMIGIKPGRLEIDTYDSK
ncbi:MAG TPA: hypothetical protein VFW11_01405 [Cyclobacteriaceae bacterium]|nr:hypothetical protein [Cyclobacteriaceae bacterium]